MVSESAAGASPLSLLKTRDPSLRSRAAESEPASNLEIPGNLHVHCSWKNPTLVSPVLSCVGEEPREEEVDPLTPPFSPLPIRVPTPALIDPLSGVTPTLRDLSCHR